MTESAGVHVVVVSYNTRDLLRQCLQSLEGDRGLITAVTVVDNASADGSVEMLRAEFSWVEVEANADNPGFAVAVNPALFWHPNDHFLLRNPDTEMHSGSLPGLVEVLDQHPGAGLAGPSEARPGGNAPALSAGHQPRLWRLLMHYSGISRQSRGRPWIEGLYLLRGVNDDRMREVGWVSGSCMLIRANVAERLGPLTERWFMYAEDLEYCLRATRAGYSVWYVPGAAITHHVGASSRAVRTTTNVAWVTSMKQYYRQEWRPRRATYLLWRAVLAVGLLSRWAPERMRQNGGGDVRRARANDLLAYAREAWVDDWKEA
jgi:N-acetylglucosaminyl-diphospho-decaprenol L-rhamnosyltransferase